MTLGKIVLRLYESSTDTDVWRGDALLMSYFQLWRQFSKPADLTRMRHTHPDAEVLTGFFNVTFTLKASFIRRTLEWHWQVVARPARCSRKWQTFSQWWCHREVWDRGEEMKKFYFPRTTVSLFQPTHEQSKYPLIYMGCAVCVQQPYRCISWLITFPRAAEIWLETEEAGGR